MNLPYVGDTADDSSGYQPLGQSPRLYLFWGFRGISLAFECYRSPVDTPDNIRGSSLREDTPMDVDCLGSGQRVKIAEDRLYYPCVL